MILCDEICGINQGVRVQSRDDKELIVHVPAAAGMTKRLRRGMIGGIVLYFYYFYEFYDKIFLLW